MKVYFKKQVKSIKKQFSERRTLLKPLIKKYGKPVIVHSVQNTSTFNKILEDGRLKLPNQHNSPKKTPYMEKYLKIDNCLYYSLGFVYYSSYKWEYNLIFDLEFIKQLDYYNISLSFKIYRAVVDYLYDNDRKFLEKIADINKTTREVIDRYYFEPYEGRVRKILEFWKIEKELYQAIVKYPDQKALIKIIKETQKKCFVKYPASKKQALEVYKSDKAPEMIGKDENNLLTNPYFRGFFIPSKIEKKTLKILREKYPGKIIFNGKTIKLISK